MFTPPLRNSSPTPGLHARTSAVRTTTLSPRDSRNSPRPTLKRQATAPLPLSSTVPAKKRRDTLMAPVKTEPSWSNVVHSAFLEALQRHPPVPEWRFDDSCRDAPADAQTEYCRIIQNYILKKTGCPQSFQQVSEQIGLVLSSPLASPLFKTSTEPNSCIVLGDESHDANKRSLGLHRKPIQHDKTISLDVQEVVSSDLRASESPSMSRRRKACNRPALNLHVDLPPIANPFSSNMELFVADSRESVSSGLTPLTTSFRPFLCEGELSPSTPLGQCQKGPLVLPEIPRINDIDRVKTSRWIPTPTEGVVPSLSYPSAIPSPLSTSSHDSSDESSSSESTRSNVTEGMQKRPEMPNRTTSWPSMSKRVAPACVDTSGLPNPVTSFAESEKGSPILAAHENTI